MIKKKTAQQLALEAQKKLKAFHNNGKSINIRNGNTEKFKKLKKDKPELDAEITDENQSLFEKKLKGIRKETRRTNYDERAKLKIYKGLLDMILDLIPIAETNYRKYKVDKSAYALNVMTNQAREIINDLRSVQDFEAHASKISDMVREHFAQVARNLVDESYALKKNIRDENNPKVRRLIEDKIDATTRSHGRFMNETVKALEGKITSFLVEKPDNGKVGRAAHGAKRNNPN